MMPPIESSPHLKIEFAQASDAGRDPNKQINEDACGYAETKFGYLCVLCDGMGGHYGGSEASRTAIKTIFEMIEQAPPAMDPKAALKAAIEEAGRRVYQLGGPPENRVRPGSTVVAMVLHERGVDVAHVGDSRAYVIRSHQIYPLTRDHSMVQGMIDAGMITEAQAIGHPDANKITRALGMKPEVEVEVRPEPMELYPGDVLIQSSDGLTDLVLPGDILGCTRQALASGSVDHACRMLVQLANHRGGHDNITVQMVRVIEAGSRSQTIAHGPPAAFGAGDGGNPARASRPQETVAMTRSEATASGQQHATSTPLPHGHGAHAAGAPWGPAPPPTTGAHGGGSPAATGAAAGAAPAIVGRAPAGGVAASASAAGSAAADCAVAAGPAAASGAAAGKAAAGSAPAPYPASINNAITVVPTGSADTPAPRPASTSNATTAVPAGSTGTPGLRPPSVSGVPAVAPTATDNVPAVAPTATDNVPAVAPTATDNVPAVAPAAAHGAPALRPTAVDGAPAVSPTATDDLPPVAPAAAPGASAVSPTAADSGSAMTPTPMDSALALPPTVPGARVPAPYPNAPDAPAVLSPLPLSAPAAPAPPPMARAAPPQPGAFGAPPHAGAAYGALPHPGVAYGAPPHQGAAYGAPPQAGAAYGALPHPTEQDAPPASVAFPGDHPAAPGGPPVAAAPHPHLAPASPHAYAYAAAGARPAPAPSFSGPVSSSLSSGASSVPSTVRASRGVYIAVIASASTLILVVLFIVLWKLLAG
ncbi:protein phosphatase 2C domain-containing protein [Sorangium sp. So ce1000]|uniref:PP2C family protein-serine/threonine phosphatase n=1 Tax=Sorangium sp. So ce1000 TaxID=3133325 RepID=UPI003F5F2C7F